jgi:hypothetical protein
LPVQALIILLGGVLPPRTKFWDKLTPGLATLRVPSWTLFALLGLVLALTAKWMLWSTFMMYDDEGYVLTSLKSFSEHGGLYDDIFTQYGPFYFLLGHSLHLLGVAYCAEAARALTLFAWLGSACFASAAVWSISGGGRIATLFTLSAVFAYQWPMISEPSHPGSFISLCVAFLAWAGCARPLHLKSLAILTGLLGGCLVLIKINVGLLLLAGAGTWLVLHSKIAERRPALKALTMLLLLATPWVLMRPLLGEAWVLSFAILVCCSLAACLLVCRTDHAVKFSGANFTALALSLLFVAVATFAFVLLKGTSWRGLLDGVLLSPLQMPAVFTSPIKWRTGTLILSAASLLAALAWYRFDRKKFLPWLVGLRLCAVLGFLCVWTGLLERNFHALVMSYGLSAVWAFVVPLRKEDKASPARLWLALLLLTQSMHAFPVAGSQLCWGSFLWIPLAALALEEVWTLLRGSARPLLLQAAEKIPLLVLLGSLFACAKGAQLAWTRYNDGDRLELPGAESLILPESYTSSLRILVQNAREYGGPLHSMPGMLSLNLWSGVATPTLSNATHWFTLLPEKRQNLIRSRLEASDSSVLIVERSVYDYLKKRNIRTEAPLTLWLFENFQPLFKLDTYEFWVRKGRSLVPLSIAHIRESQDRNQPRFMIDVTLKTEVSARVARMELHRFMQNKSVLLQSWGPGELKALVSPLDASPGLTPARYKADMPFPLIGKVQLLLFTDVFPSTFLPRESVLRFFDEQGRRIAEARFAE